MLIVMSSAENEHVGGEASFTTLSRSATAVVSLLLLLLHLLLLRLVFSSTSILLNWQQRRMDVSL